MWPNAEFARDLKHPNLWDGCLVSYCPSFTGPTGKVIPDLTGRGTTGLHIGRAASSIWVRSGGQYALDFTGGDAVEFKAFRYLIPGGAAPRAYTFTSWFNSRDVSVSSAILDVPLQSCSVFVIAGGTQIGVVFGSDSINYIDLPITLVNNTWYHVGVRLSNPVTRRVEVFINGMGPFDDGLNAGTSYNNGITHWGNNPSGAGVPFDGLLDDLRVYNRSLRPSEFKLLATRRSVSFERSPRIFAATSSEITRSESETLNVVDSATFNIEVDGVPASASNALVLAQNTSYFLLSDVFQVEQTLGLTDTVKVFGYEYGTDILSLAQATEFRIGIPTAGYFLTDELNLTQSMSRGQTYGVVDTLVLTDVGASVTPTSDMLALAQSVTLATGRSVLDTLVFTQATLSESLYGRSVVHTNWLQHAVGYYVLGIGKCGKSKYSRFEGAGADSGIAPKTKSSNHIPVAFESLTGSPSPVFIRAPEMDDKNRMAFDRVNRETLGGELSVHRDTIWPTTRSMLFTVVGIKTSIFESLQAFMLATLGLEVLFHDWTGTTWRGIVTNPEETATEDRDGYWTVAFEFEGAPYEGPPANHSLALSQVTSFTIE